MKLARSLRGLAVVASVLLIMVLLAIMVAALDEILPLVVLAGVVVLAYSGWRVASKHVGSGTVLELDLDKGVVEQPPSSPIDRALNTGAVVLRDVVDALDRAGVDDRVVGLVARLGNGHIGMAKAQELRDAITRFRQSGKRAVAFSETFGEGSLATVDYYLATAFGEIYLQPSGSVGIEGVLARSPFLRRLLDRIKVTPDLGHREEYKGAKYLLTESEYVAPHREATEAILAEHFEQIVAGISAGRGVNPERARELIDAAPLTARESLEARLVDGLKFRDEAYEAARASDGRGLMYASRYLKKAGRPHRRGERIALIYGTGSIHRGTSSFDPMSRSSSMGSDEVASAFRKAVDDKKTKGIVFRVDSPGGSAVASDVISREVDRARKAGKPVVVSMGDVAGSGGYWVSAPADRIVAQPGTITGSIGVLSGKLARGEAWSSIGVDFDEIHLGRNATTWDPIRPFTDSERERNEAFLDRIYEDFLEHVARSRTMDVEQVRAVAKGRVWTGQRARELGLVDSLGGMSHALTLIKELAGIGAEDRVQVTVFPQPRTIPLPKRDESSEPIGVMLRSVYDLVDRVMGGSTGGYELRMPGW